MINFWENCLPAMRGPWEVQTSFIAESVVEHVESFRSKDVVAEIELEKIEIWTHFQSLAVPWGTLNNGFVNAFVDRPNPF